jgi:hypothetical protein
MLVGENEHVILVRLSFLQGKELRFRDYHTAFVCCVCVRAFVTALHNNTVLWEYG